MQAVRDEQAWEEWVLFILDGIEVVAKQSIELIKQIKILMLEYKHHIRDNYKFYSQDLINNLFKHPYTKIEFLKDDLNVERKTAANYLNTLAKDSNEIITKLKIGNSNYYINNQLMGIITSYDYNVRS